MAKVVVTDSKLNAIANAINNKTGENKQMTLDEMASAIEGINSTRLPSEYQEVAYIDGTGTQYIDTEVPFNSCFMVFFDFMVTDLSGMDGIGFAGVNNTSHPYCTYLNYSSSTSNYFQIGNSLPTINTYITAEENIRYKLFESIGNAPNHSGYTSVSITISNNTKHYTSSNNKSSLVNESDTIYLFGMHNDNDITDACVPYRLYSCSMFDTYCNKIRDFIPCYRKSDNRVGLYDLVNNVFYDNKNTDNFIAGDIVS